eukprot:3385301-Rhodomonas_salina.1
MWAGTPSQWDWRGLHGWGAWGQVPVPVPGYPVLRVSCTPSYGLDQILGLCMPPAILPARLHTLCLYSNATAANEMGMSNGFLATAHQAVLIGTAQGYSWVHIR